MNVSLTSIELMSTDFTSHLLTNYGWIQSYYLSVNIRDLYDNFVSAYIWYSYSEIVIPHNMSFRTISTYYQQLMPYHNTLYGVRKFEFVPPVYNAEWWFYLYFIKLFGYTNLMLLVNGFLGLIIAMIFYILKLILDMPSIIRLFLILFSMFGVVGANSTITSQDIYVITFILGFIFYVGVGTGYDYYMHRSRLRNINITNNHILNHLIIGVLYALWIISGVFATNSLWYLSYDVEGGISNSWAPFAATSILTVIFSTVWRYLSESPNIERYDIIHSFFRSLFECLSFCCIAWSTYASWYMWLHEVATNVNVLGLIIGLIIHIIFSTLVIIGELGSPNRLYGIWYLFSFTGVAFSTNGLFALFSHITQESWPFYLVLGLTLAGTVIFHPEVYRVNNNVERRYLQIAWHVLCYYLVVVCFVFSSGILYSLQHLS